MKSPRKNKDRSRIGSLYGSVLSRRVYEARTSQSVGQRLSQTNLLSIFGSSRERVEYVHVKGLGDKVGWPDRTHMGKTGFGT